MVEIYLCKSSLINPHACPTGYEPHFTTHNQGVRHTPAMPFFVDTQIRLVIFSKSIASYSSASSGDFLPEPSS